MTNKKSKSNPGPYESLDLYPVEGTIWERTTSSGKVYYNGQVIRKFRDESGYRGTPSYGLHEADKFIQATEWVKDRLTVLNKKEAA